MATIRKVEVKNYKSLKEISVEVSPAVTIISGKNNAGKSTFLEALFIFYDRMNPIMPVRDITFRGIQGFSDQAFNNFSHLFYNRDINRTINITVHDDKTKSLTLKSVSTAAGLFSANKIGSIEKELSGDNSNFANGGRQLEMKYIINNSIKTQGYFSGQSNQIGLNIQKNEVENENQIVFLGSRGGSNNSEDAQRFSRISLAKEDGRFIEMMKKFDPSINNIRIQVDVSGPYLSVVSNSGMESPLGLYGGGSRRLLEILLAITFAKGGIVLIDEIENGFHYSKFDQIWKMIYEFAKFYRTQVFAVTHSYEMLESAVAASASLDRNIIVNKFSKGESSIDVKIYDYKLAKLAIDEGVELR